MTGSKGANKFMDAHKWGRRREFVFDTSTEHGDTVKFYSYIISKVSPLQDSM